MPSTGEQYPLSILTTIRQALQKLEDAAVEPNRFLQGLIDNSDYRDAMIKLYEEFYPQYSAILPDSPRNLNKFAEDIAGVKYENVERFRERVAPHYLSYPWLLEVKVAEQTDKNKQVLSVVEFLGVDQNFVSLFEGLNSITVKVAVLFFGLETGERLTVLKIARELDIPHSQVYRMSQQAMVQFRAVYRRSLDPVPESVLDLPIEDLHLPERARSVLRRLGISTIGLLIQKTEDDLLSMNNFGEVMLRSVKFALEARGLSLKQ